MEKQTKDKDKNKQMQGYDKTDRDFQATEEDRKDDAKQNSKLQPEKYPVNEESSRQKQ